MLRQIQIKNFQSHKNTVIDFQKGINAITGTSDAGKSSVIRALKWLFFNRPRGEGFKSNFAEDTDIISVKATFDDVIIERCKGPNVNSYIITPILEDGKLGTPNLCKALRTDIPSEVSDVLRMTDVNFQEQHSPYFLLNDTPGEVASAFNRVSKLEIMDACMLEATRIVNELREKEKQINVQIEDTNSQIEDFYWVDNAEKELLSIEKYDAALADCRFEFSNLRSICDDYLKIKKQIDSLAYIKRADDLYKSIERTAENRSALKKEIEYIHSVLNNKKRLRREISKLSFIDTAKLELDELSQLREDLLSVQNERELLVPILHNMKKIKRKKFKLKKEINALDKKFKEALSQLGICPLCESVLQ